jgi:hypothetical protein
MEGIYKLLGSRRFIVLIIGMVFQVAVIYIPDLKPYAPKLQEYTVYLVGLAIAGYSLQDIAREVFAKAGNILHVIEDVVAPDKPAAG